MFSTVKAYILQTDIKRTYSSPQIITQRIQVLNDDKR